MKSKVKILATVVLAVLIFPVIANALPEGESVAVGDATFVRTEDTLNINTPSERLIVNYDSFNIAQQETVNFNQPSSSAIALNRVTGVSPSEIFGTLTANGIIYVINERGVTFGPNSRVDAAAVLASTLDTSDSDFLAGKSIFLAGNENAFILNQGNIKVSNGGFIGLLSAAVKNEGLLEAELGTVVMAAGEKITLALDDLNDISVVINEGVQETVAGFDSAIANSGTISANGGKVILSADVLNDVFDQSINNTGIIEAGSIQSHNGEIILVGAGAPVTNIGKISASGTQETADGGKVSIIGASVLSSGLIQANAAEAGAAGEIIIVAESDVTLDAASTTEATAAVLNGAGGRIKISSSAGSVIAAGAVNVDGGLVSGNAGTIDIDAYVQLEMSGIISGRAPPPPGFNSATVLLQVNLPNDPSNAELYTLDLSGVIVAGKVYLYTNQRADISGIIIAPVEVVLDSQGARFSGFIATDQGTYNMNDGDTLLSGGYIGDQSWTDSGHIVVDGLLIVDGNIYIEADDDDSGSGDFIQNAGTLIVGSGDMEILGANLVLGNIVFGGDEFLAIAKTGGINVYGVIVSREVEVIREIIRLTESIILDPIADSYTKQTIPEENYGDDPHLLISSGSGNEVDWTWLKFDLTAIPDDADISSVILTLDALNGKNVSVGAYHTADDSWTELGIRWNNQPGGLIFDSKIGPPILSGLNNWNLDANIIENDLLDNYTSWALMAEGIDDQPLKFWSREGGLHGPQSGPSLGITYSTIIEEKVAGCNIGGLQDGTITLVSTSSTGDDITFTNNGQAVTLGRVNIDALTGAIVNQTSGINVIADELVMNAVEGIGSDKAIKTRINKLRAWNTTSGNLRVDNYGQDLYLVDLESAGFAVQNDAPCGEIEISVFSLNLDYVYNIDGDIADWGIYLYNLGGNVIEYLDVNLPSGGNDIDYWTEDNCDIYHLVAHYVGPMHSWKNLYDAEAVYIDSDGTNLYIVVVTGVENVSHNPGDIGIDIDGDGIYEYAILRETTSYGREPYLCSVAGTPIYKPGAKLGWLPSAGDRDKFWIVYDGFPIAPVEFVYSENQNSHYVMEAKVPLSLLGLDSASGQDVGVHWTMSCGNDLVELIGDINPLCDVNLIVQDEVTGKGNISFYADGYIKQLSNGIVTIDQSPSLVNPPQIVRSTSHDIRVWSPDNTIDVEWNLPEQGAVCGHYTATALDEYIMNRGSAVYTNGGDATITANNDIKLTLIDAQNGDVTITSNLGSIIDGDLGVAPADYDVIGRTIVLTAAGSVGGPSPAEIDLGYPTLGFSYLWDMVSTTDPDGTPETSYTAVFNPYGNNEWWFQHTSPALSPDSDNWFFHIATLGSQSATAHLGPFYIDTTSPQIIITLDPASPNGLNGWYITVVDSSATASDPTPGSGINAGTFQYSYDGGVWTAYTAGAIVPLTDEGIVNIAFRVNDNVGHLGTASKSVKIDLTDPTVTITLDPASPNGLNNWYVTNVDSSATADDYIPGSGVDPSTFEYSYDGSAWFAYSTGGIVTLSEEGFSIPVYYRVKDLAGRSGAASLSIKIDKTAPVIDITNPTDGMTYPAAQTLLYTVTDNVSGVDTVGGPLSGTVYSDNGAYDITITAVDFAGNNSLAGVRFIIDIPAPGLALNTYGLVIRYYWPPQEELGGVNVEPTDIMSSDAVAGPVFFYHPLTPSDMTGFEEFLLDEGLYEFIDGNLNFLENTPFFMFMEEEKKKKQQI
ncbi:filamentous hemagglutinin N-terminal domain-containing protein [Candidatus Omnitrophota bacterium]